MKKLLKSKIFWLIIVILIIGGAVAVRYFSQEKKVEYVTEQIKRGSVVQTVSATGKVKSASEINLNFKNTGKLSVLKVKVGDKVNPGQILAQLKATDLAIGVNRAAADLEEARANLDKLKVGVTPQEIAVSEAAVAKAQTDLASAQTDLENTEATYKQALVNERASILVNLNAALTKANISLQKVYDTLNYKGQTNNFITSNTNLHHEVETGYSNSITKVDEAKLAYNIAQLNFEDEKIDEAVDKTLVALTQTSQTLDNLANLFNYVILTSILTQSELETLKTTINTERVTIDTSINTIQTAKHDLADVRLNYQTKVRSAENAVFVAEKNLTKAKTDLEFKKAPARAEDIILYEARVRKAQADLQLAQDKYGETIILAPIAGVITDINFDVGEQTSLSQPAITMLAAENYEIEVNIPESDIVKLDVGDETKITFDAFTDEDIFSGVVANINPAQTEIQDVIYYRVTVALQQEQPANVVKLKDKIKPGMTANVTVNTAHVDNVLIIPLRAVKEESGKKIVQVLENNQPISLEVTLGLKGDEGLVEVISGLTEGQKIIVFVREGK